MLMSRLLAAAVAATTLMAAGAASADVYNISATNGAGVNASLSAGTYQLSFVGTGQMAAYQAFNYYGGGNSGWSNALQITNSGVSTNYYTGDSVGNQTLYSSSAASLSAYQAASSFDMSSTSAFTGMTSAPLTFTVLPGATVNFAIADSNYADNVGGVSIDVEPTAVSAAPEPGVWALMLGGVGAMGLMLRRRRRSGAIFAA